MRSDLLEANASLEWAVSNFPALEKRLMGWVQDNISVVFKDADFQSANYIVLAVEKNPLPLILIAEAGAYINSMRAALDILAVAVAERHGIPNPDNIYFPVARSEQAWLLRDFKGLELIQSTPVAVGQVFKDLKPYPGGNDILAALHQFDVRRKHSRLLSVQHQPARLKVGGDGFKATDVTFPAHFIEAGNGETVLCFISKGLANPKVNYIPEIFLTETNPDIRRPVMVALAHFAEIVGGIIAKFDGS
jgi:hypothetical protein